MQPLMSDLPHWLQLALILAPALGTSFAAIALILNVSQSRKTNAQARAALVAGSLKGFAEDQDIQRAFYAIEYSEFKYDDSFHKSDRERQVDKLLRHFANIALAWQARLLSTSDVRPIQYYVLTVVRDAEIQKYLDYVAAWTKEGNLGEHPYAVLSSLAQELGK